MASGQSASEQLTDPTPYKIAYGLSFLDYDSCGDSEAGRIVRRAVLEKLARCPFSPEAMDEFQEWRIQNVEGMLADLILGQSKGLKFKGPPEVADGTVASCEEYREMPRYQSKRADLLRYDRGEIDVDAVIGEECHSGPASL